MNDNATTEKCVLCQEDTGIPRDVPVDDVKRLGCYIEGAGQVCPRCAGVIFREEFALLGADSSHPQVSW